MTLFQRQAYEANFNYVGTILLELFKKSKDQKRKKASNIIKAFNEMYMHTNMLNQEVLVLQRKLEIERTAKLRAIKSLKKIRDNE